MISIDIRFSLFWYIRWLLVIVEYNSVFFIFSTVIVRVAVLLRYWLYCRRLSVVWLQRPSASHRGIIVRSNYITIYLYHYIPISLYTYISIYLYNYIISHYNISFQILFSSPFFINLFVWFRNSIKHSLLLNTLLIIHKSHTFVSWVLPPGNIQNLITSINP